MNIALWSRSVTRLIFTIASSLTNISLTQSMYIILQVPTTFLCFELAPSSLIYFLKRCKRSWFSPRGPVLNLESCALSLNFSFPFPLTYSASFLPIFNSNLHFVVIFECSFYKFIPYILRLRCKVVPQNRLAVRWTASKQIN